MSLSNMIFMQTRENVMAQYDKKDPPFARDQFDLPDTIYLCGNSLGPKPKKIDEYLAKELKDWKERAVRGHFDADKTHPWVSRHHASKEGLAKLAGATSDEVVPMGSLTANLHNLLISFYTPTSERFKIIIFSDAFRSDRRMVVSQIHQRWHTLRNYFKDTPIFDPKEALVEIKPTGKNLTTQDILDTIEKEGDKAQLILIETVTYKKGEIFDYAAISKAAHAKDCLVGHDVAHAMGNIPLQLKKWDVDFAAGCTYKYLNAGPGSTGFIFVNAKHHHNSRPHLSGWWSEQESSRFNMDLEFNRATTVDQWQISNPSILDLAALESALDIFKSLDLDDVRARSKRLTGFLEKLIKKELSQDIEILTPENPDERGCQLSLRLKHSTIFNIEDWFFKHGVILDVRHDKNGDIIRVAPTGLFTTYEELDKFMGILLHLCQELRPKKENQILSSHL